MQPQKVDAVLPSISVLLVTGLLTAGLVTDPIDRQNPEQQRRLEVILDKHFLAQ